jgi:hypothetical protein
VPERTIDAWTSSVITSRESRALLWAPTPPAQAPGGGQPWDIAAELTPAKLLVIENKSLINSSTVGIATRIQIDMQQLLRFLSLGVLDGLPVFYGLPGPQPHNLPFPVPPEIFVQREAWRLNPPFQTWERMVRPTELLMFAPVLAAFQATQSTATINTAFFHPFRSLLDLLEAVLACTEGARLPPVPEKQRRPSPASHSGFTPTRSNRHPSPRGHFPVR